MKEGSLNLEEINKKITASKKGIRKNICNDLFERVLYIKPNSLVVKNYIRNHPVVAFNPGALLRENELEIYPRLVFDYYWYVSSIGKFKLNLNKIEKGVNEPIEVDVILYPKEEWEIRGVEDPRVFFIDNQYYLLYTAVQLTNGTVRPLQALAIVDDHGKIYKKLFMKLKFKDKILLPSSWKDSAILKLLNKNSALLLTRPSLGSFEVCWACNVDLVSGEVDISSLFPVILNEDFEKKIGWSTNVEKISSNEYLVGWHGVGYDMKYRNGIALLNGEGKLKAITDYILEPIGINELYGDRPFVVFGCGLAKKSNELYWIGGISDYAIGIFRTCLDKIFEYLRWIDKS